VNRGVDAHSTISLVDLDPELGAELPPLELARVRQRTQVAAMALEPGEWRQEDERDPGATCAILVLEGMLLRELVLAGVPSAELLGPGDLSATGSSGDEFLPTSVRWTVVSRARVALVDERLASALHIWPRLLPDLLSRATQQMSRLALQRAIAHLPRVEDRLLALFWHLAERWGRVGKTGVIIPLSLTHTVLGRLVGARRPTISLALKELEQRGLLARREDGSWVVGVESLATLQTTDVESAAPSGISLVGALEGEAAPAELGPPAVAPHAAAAAEVSAMLRRIPEMRTEHDARLKAVAATLERAQLLVAQSRALRQGAPGSRSR